MTSPIINMLSVLPLARVLTLMVRFESGQPASHHFIQTFGIKSCAAPNPLPKLHAITLACRTIVGWVNPRQVF